MCLSSLLMGYGPLIDRDRRILALQLRFSPLDGKPLALSTLYRSVAGERPIQGQTLVISAPWASFDPGMDDIEPVPGLWVEVPAWLAEQSAHEGMLLRLHERGMGLVLQGRPSLKLPGRLVPIFRLAMVDVADERRQQSGGLRDEQEDGSLRRSMAIVQSGVSTVAAMEQAFEAGAYAVSGWLMPEPLDAQAVAGGADYAGVLRLLKMVERDAALRDIEAVIRQEPEIAFRLLKHIDSVGFGLSVPVQNFQHAVMFLGYQGLRRWLSMMLVSVSPDENRRPLMLASVRRGLVLERLAGRGAEREAREELFLLGVFSLLDRALGQSFEQLFAQVPVPEVVAEALVLRTGPYAALLEIVEAIEYGPDPALLVHLENCHIALEECNAVMLDTLRVTTI
ncbi:MAG: HDOD domain-containing protein [Lautropia sp.]|nr:HDOD domain-containing protein [Lautropia sp.]